jgi:archaellum component FlaG (FlaF/FlaG flagellin family)
MEKIESKSFRLQVYQFIIYLVALIITAMLAWGTMDTRVSVIETRMENKADKQELFQRLDDMRVRIEQKIETEVNKIKK